MQSAKYKTRQENDLILNLIDLVKDDAKIAFAKIGDVVNWKSYDVPLLDEFGKPRLDKNGNQIISHETNVYLKSSDEVDPSVIDKFTSGNGITAVKLKDSDKAKERLYKYFNNSDDENNNISAVEKLLSAITQGVRNDNQDR